MCYKVRRFLITSCACAWPIILGQANPLAKDNGTAVGRSVVDLPLDYHSSELPDSPGKDKSIQLASKAPSSLLAFCNGPMLDSVNMAGLTSFTRERYSDELSDTYSHLCTGFASGYS